MHRLDRRVKVLEAGAPDAVKPIRIVFEPCAPNGPEQVRREVADLEAKGFHVLHISWLAPQDEAT